MIDGGCDPRFAVVREAFAANFAHHGEVGAAVCVVVGGCTVVDPSPRLRALIDAVYASR